MVKTPFQQGGFSLIEALTALLVAAFGMLVIAGFQVSLSQSSDIAKQRSEAVRLAQLKLEELRAYQQVASHTGTPHIFNYTDDVVTGNDTVSPTSGAFGTNTSYARAWTVTGGGGDPQKWVHVAVSWTDRTNTTQTISLQTVIAKSDPISIGTLAVGPGGITARTPKNRNVNIPYPAIPLANGMSAFQPGSDSDPNPNPFYVFDDVSGDVLGYCTFTLNRGDAVTFVDDDGTGTTTTGCTKEKAYLLSGYIRFVSGGYNQNQVDNAFGNPTGATRSLDAQVNFIAPTSSASGTCYSQRQKVVNVGNISVKTISSASRSGGITTITTSGNHGFDVGQVVAINDVANDSFNGTFTIATKTNTTFTYLQAALGNATGGSGTLTPTAVLVQRLAIAEGATPPPGYSDQGESKFVAYTCIIVPFDHDGDGISGTRKRWSGQFLIRPTSVAGAWSLGTSNGTYKLCRYTGDYVLDGVLSNSEHPLYYRGVTGALDNQNYVVVDGNVACPYDAAANTAASDYINSNTTLHQTESAATCSALPCGGLRTGTNSGGATRNGGFAIEENSNTSIELPMFKVGD